MLDAAQFKEALLDFINMQLPQIHAGRNPGQVTSSSPLFDPGPIDSLGIIHLLSFIEQTTGRTLPTRMVDLEHFRTVDVICDMLYAQEKCEVRT